MKLLSFLDHLANPAATQAAPRRALLLQAGRVAAAALPLGMGTTLPAAAETKDTAYDAAVQLLLLERLQVALYTRGLTVSGLIPAAQVPDFQRLLSHQTQHVALLAQALQNAGVSVPATPTFDFSGQHNTGSNPVLFPNVLTNYDSFLALAQQIEDLGVRLYKAHAFDFANDSQLAKAVLRFHAVEAQHAAHIRGLRRNRGVVVSGWPSDEDTAIVRPTAAQALTVAATGGEENPTQYQAAGTPVPFASLLLIRDNTAVHDPALAEAFDEPVGTAAAQAALNLFI